ncbi:hypothetical protein [Tritonibacter scottomollicae]|uniref:TrbC/VIRB2 family protein n=1 Tax=Tritonibacter scottomollicae TaxID=483013 RepID=A0A2T1AHD3_TRISK|nr:hypothetical protein [Tritonibacter scottomollicae]PRZ48010.1 hypothetical protein CLV89_105235 [Tritonibacter scottomollicae]
MVAPLIWAGVALGGLYLGGKAMNEVGETVDGTAKLVKWATAGGALYVSYRALQSGGVLK